LNFLSPDPFIPDAHDLQAYNRYAYVLNNPLRYTDPDGYKPKLSSMARLFAASAAALFVPGLAQQAFAELGVLLYGTGFAAGSGTAVAASAAGGFTAGLIAGGGDLRTAVYSGVSAGLFTGIGAFGTHFKLDGPQMIGAHAAGGCASGALLGGGCGRQAVAAATGKAMTIYAPTALNGDIGRGVVSVMAGGTASYISGGKFGNGALTAGMG
jgi:hypothetical protein